MATRNSQLFFRLLFHLFCALCVVRLTCTAYTMARGATPPSARETTHDSIAAINDDNGCQPTHNSPNFVLLCFSLPLLALLLLLFSNCEKISPLLYLVTLSTFPPKISNLNSHENRNTFHIKGKIENSKITHISTGL